VKFAFVIDVEPTWATASFETDVLPPPPPQAASRATSARVRSMRGRRVFISIQ
jgi:hypothetical protein